MVRPIKVFEPRQPGETCRYVDEWMPVAPASLQQEYAVVGVGTQAVGEHTAGGPSADDNEIVFHSLAYRWDFAS